MAQCYVATKSVPPGRWYSKQVRKRDHNQETRFITFVKGFDPDATNQGWKSNFVPQNNDTEVAFGPNN